MSPDDRTALTPFSALTQAMRHTDDGHTITLPSDWLQGRTAYGGLSSALCLEAARRSIADLPPLRSAQFCFVGPATGDLQLRAEVLRRGKSTVLAGVELVGESGIAVRGTLCFGTERASLHNHSGLDMPEVRAPAACPDYYTWPVRPNFMSHFEGQLAAGSRPATPGADPTMTVWVRHRDEGNDADIVRLLALADALPPASLVLGNVDAISTMTWSIDMLDGAPTTRDGWWLVHAVADTSRLGYSAQSTVIWNADGAPILLARQNVAIFG